MLHGFLRQPVGERSSPDDVDTCVEAKFFVAGDDRDFLGQRLCQKLPVERVGVVTGQIENLKA